MLVLLLALAPAPQEPAPIPRPDSGLEFATPDGAWSLRLGGKLQFDRARGTGEVRRSRLDLRGRAAALLGWRASADFRQDSGAELRDLYLEVETGPLGELRLGHFRQPYGLENRGSSSSFTFFERSIANALSPARDAGLMLHDRWPAGTWAVGAFRETHSDAFGVDSGDAADRSLSARLTWLPLDEEDGARLVHLGGSFRHLDPDPGGFAVEERPEAHLAPKMIAATFAADRVEQLGLEAAAVLGPTSLQAEWQRAWVDAAGGGPALDGAYLQVAHTLTGEVRGYQRVDGVFGRVEPAVPLGEGGGAWELAARVSRLDLGPAGSLEVLSLALNWYWAENLKLQWGWSSAEGPDGAPDTFQFRLHLDW